MSATYEVAIAGFLIPNARKASITAVSDVVALIPVTSTIRRHSSASWPKPRKKADGRTCLKDNVDFGGGQLQRRPLHLRDCFRQPFHGDIMYQGARLDQANTVGHGAAPLLGTYGFWRR